MARVSRFLLTLASGSALYSGLVPALGLGEITLHSALNQPLEAEIELLEVGDLNAGEVKVSLASAEAYQRSGVERFVFLNDLRFTPVLRGGRGIIRVASSQPVREPYLNFLIEVARPNGSLLREYTLLLDPPGSTAYAPVAAVQPSAAAAPLSERRPLPSQPQPQAAPPAATMGERYSVAHGDSLWLIAARLREAGSQASQQALMNGIHALNPHAFVGGDSNRLMLGAELLLPDMAVAEVLARGAQPAPAAAPQPVAVEPVAQAASAPAANAEPQQIAELQRLVDTQLAAQRAENRQLHQRLAELQQQVESLQQQVNARDQRVAALQAQLADRMATASQERPAVEGAAGQAHGLSFGRALVASGLLLSLLAGGLLWRRRYKARQAEALRSQPQPRMAPETVEPVISLLQADLPSARTPLAHDPLEGADIYIAYGRFEEAVSTLRKAIRQTPQRLDLQLRLFEVLGEQRDRNGFAAQEAVLQQLGAGAQLEPIKARYAELLAEPPSDPLQDAVLALDDEAEQADADQLNLEDLSLDADWDQLSPFDAPPAPAKPRLVLADDPTFRSNLRELPEVAELGAEHGSLSAFGDPLQIDEDDVLTDEFADAGGSVIGQLLDRDLEHLAGNREHLTMLNMALAYIEQGNLDSACNILNELISEGDDQEKQVARKLLARIA